jgi:GR25 family glycosyltransferase involved in LPS biosynthesis
LHAINLNNELDRRRQEKRVIQDQPVSRIKKAAQEKRFKGINKSQGGKNEERIQKLEMQRLF